MPEQPTLVFDLDGTLSDPAEGIWRCLNFALSSFDLDVIPRQEVGQYVGPPLDASFRLLAPALDEQGIRDIVARYRERYAVAGYAENILYQGIPEVLQELSVLGIPMGVCTSKREDFARRILDMFGIHRHFRFVSGGDVGISKTSQLQQLLQSGSLNQNAIMIGDRAVDIKASKDNGLRGIGVLWGYGSHEELSAAGATTLLSDPRQLLQLVGPE